MKSKILYLMAFLILPLGLSAQDGWSFEKVFPENRIGNNDYAAKTNHGIAIDPDGKIWLAPYYRSNRSADGYGAVTVSTIMVYNPDGTEASFSPISRLVISETEVDTLRSIVSGMGKNHEGNILASVGVNLYLIDYKTGEFINKRIAPFRIEADNIRHVYNSLSASDDGFVLANYVFEGAPVEILDANLGDVLNVSNASTGFSRVSAISADGKTLYIPEYTKHQVYVWYAADGVDDLDGYAITDSLFVGMQVESFAIHPVTGNLWASAGSDGNAPNQHPSDDVTTNFEKFTWYEYDLGSGAYTDHSFTWNRDPVLGWNEADGVPIDFAGGAAYADPRPRAIEFSNDGLTAYVGAFGSQGNPAVQVFKSGSVSIDRPDFDAPVVMKLNQNYPNPFNPSTRINFSVDNASHVTLKVYDLLGREVASLVDGRVSAGEHFAIFNAANLNSGVYLYTLSANGQTVTNKMMLVK